MRKHFQSKQTARVVEIKIKRSGNQYGLKAQMIALTSSHPKSPKTPQNPIALRQKPKKTTQFFFASSKNAHQKSFLDFDDSAADIACFYWRNLCRYLPSEFPRKLR